MSREGRQVDRRTLLKGVGLTALVGLGGIPLGCDDAPPAADGQPSPADGQPGILDLSFRVQAQYRPFELVAPGFEQIRRQSVSARSLVRLDAGPVAPFAAIQLAVDAAEQADVVAGLFSAGGDGVAAVFSPSRRRVSLEVRRAGGAQVLAQETVELPTPFKAAFAVCENQMTALADTGNGWQPLVTNRDDVAALIDLRDPDTLSTFSYGYGAGASGGEVRFSEVVAGPFGMAGLRDPHLVQRPDGTAYVRDGKAYLTFTCAGLGFFQQAHWGVFTLDLADPTQLRQVAQLYARRDGLVLGDHAGQLVIDEPGDRFIALNTSWGDFDDAGVHAMHTSTADDVLSGVHLLETQRLDLPTELSSWDPGATRIDDRWHVSFVESPSQDPFDFHPALAAGPAGATYDKGLELIGADPSLHQCEGPILQRVGGEWSLLASDGETRQYPVYDLAMKRLGALDAPYGTNIPHPQIVERPDGGWLMVTFDGTQYAEDVLGYGGHGDVVIMSAGAG